ncbi:MAG: ATP-binding protein [Chloroflexota bacterium]
MHNQPTIPTDTKYILLIEDELIDQMAFHRFVKQQALPYTYKIVRSVKNAIEAFKQGRFEVIISDYQLMDGTAFDFLDAIGKPDIPFILMTGAGNEELAVNALKKGANDYLIKDLDNCHLNQIPVAVEKALQHTNSEKMNHMAQFEMSRAAMLSVQPNGNVFDCNLTFARTIGFDSPEALIAGQAWQNKIRPFFEKIYSDLQEGDGYIIDQEIVLKDVKGKKLIFKANFVLVAQSEKSFFRGTLVDITSLRQEQRMRVEKELELNELQQVLKLREDFSDMLVHDLRNPISIILMSAQMMDMYADNPEKIKKLTSNILVKTETLQHLVDDMLTVARMESGNLIIEPAQKNLCKVAQEQIDGLQELASSRGLTIELTLPETDVYLKLDERLIGRVFDNLISNALKYSPRQGTVWVNVKVDQSENGPMAHVTVTDEGSGVPQEDKDHVFERYGIGSIKGERGTQTGLGLSFCKMVVEAHKGEIWITDAEPTGAIFHFSIPTELA